MVRVGNVYFANCLNSKLKDALLNDPGDFFLQESTHRKKKWKFVAAKGIGIKTQHRKMSTPHSHWELMPSNRLNNTKCYCLTLFCSIHVSQPFYMPLSFSIYPPHNELFRLKAFFLFPKLNFFYKSIMAPSCQVMLAASDGENLVVNLSVREIDNGCKSHHAYSRHGVVLNSFQKNSMEKKVCAGEYTGKLP